MREGAQAPASRRRSSSTRSSDLQRSSSSDLDSFRHTGGVGKLRGGRRRIAQEART